MMRKHISLCIVLIRSEGGSFCSWCPDVNVVSQGDSAEEAYLMCVEAMLIAFNEDLYGFETVYSPNDPWPTRVRKKIYNPLRRGELAKQDEDYEQFRQFTEREGKWGECACLDFDEFEASDEPIGMMHTSFSLTTGRGLVFVGLEEYSRPNVMVPALRLDISYEEITVKHTTLTVQSTFLDQDDVPGAMQELVKQELEKAITPRWSSGGSKLFGTGRDRKVANIRVSAKRRPMLKGIRRGG